LETQVDLRRRSASGRRERCHGRGEDLVGARRVKESSADRNDLGIGLAREVGSTPMTETLTRNGQL
jgi:hypothetical protein